MKNFISSIFKVLYNVIVLLLLLALILLVFSIFLSKLSNTSVEDTLCTMKTYAQDITGISFTDKDSVDYFNNFDDDVSENNVIKTSKTNNKFYYNQLDENAKMIYNSFENNIDNLKKDNFTIKFSTKFNTLLNQSNGNYLLNKAFQDSIDAFFYDHPELFYIDLTKISLYVKSTSIGKKTTYTVSIVPQDSSNYLSSNFNSEAEVDEAIKKVEQIKNNIISNVSNFSDYEKALKVHDTLVNLLDYSSSSNNSYNIYNALVEHKVVCEGYAKAYKYILDSLGIECILVSGNATNSTGKTDSHMWNYIKLNDKWYGVDVTWDDPVIVGSTKKLIKHNYFCKGSNVFNESHKVVNSITTGGKLFSIPTLSKTNYK